MNEIVMCTAKVRWEGCLLKKNFCCAVCEQLEECLMLFKEDPKNKIKPCSNDMYEDCELREILG
jgi:hypothetical protein